MMQSRNKENSTKMHCMLLANSKIGGEGGDQIIEGDAFESYTSLWPDNDYNKLEDNAVEFFNNFMRREIKFMDTLNGVLCIDVANAPSFWFIMNSVDKRKPDNDFLCPRALNALKCAHYHDTIIVLQTHNVLRKKTVNI